MTPNDLIRLQEFKNEFSEARGVHFNNAGMAPLSRSVAQEVRALIEAQLKEGSFACDPWIPRMGSARTALAEHLGAKPEWVAFFQNCSTALSQVALGFPLRSGDQVVTIDQEYSSSFYPWKVACDRAGAKLVVVSSEESQQISMEKLLAAIRPGVRLVGVSWVQFQTGSLLDLKSLGEHCRSVGAFLVVDVIQGVGQLPISLSDSPVDAIAGGSHKWMCSVIGQGYLAIKPELLKLLSPLSVGGGTYNRIGYTADLSTAMEPTARKFEAGGASFVPLFALQTAIEVQKRVGIPVIAEEILRLSRRLRDGLLNAEVKLITPRDQAGGVTSFLMPPESEARFLNVCREKGISLAKREKYIRVSMHAFNTDEQVDQLLEVFTLFS